MLTTDRQIDRRILLEADSLEAAGWTVTILATQVDSARGDEDSRVVRPPSGSSVATRENPVFRGYRWVRRVIPMDGFVMSVLKRFAWRYLIDQEAFFTRLLADAAERYSPDVFVAHDLPMLPLAWQQAARCGAKLVYDSHELYCEQEFSKHEKKCWAQIESRYIGRCDAVITVNVSIAAELEKRYGIRDVGVIYNADRASSPPAYTKLFHTIFALPESTRVLLLQGGLSAGRNLESLIEGMAHVRDDSIVLVVLGDGPMSKILASRVQSLGLSRRVFFHAAVPQEDLSRYTVAADAGVIPYLATCLNNYFCTPNKLFEFIAAGLPILASDLPEIAKMVKGRSIGLVGDMSGAVSIGRLVEEFFFDEVCLAEWRRNASLAREEVCWEVEGGKLVAIYDAVMKMPPSFLSDTTKAGERAR
ncbi:glycosyltransferase family 4 protein [Azonexus sp.]|uniref:glycosyltransferase family 4 protein n=1 Tax=Azonexus sp. TaxID=1872668 RepID=UPI00281DA335|nr:glycosyltransferase family 4 protein [Azonexus sp.]MDR1995921.1 glycosyltransferase family 4 protein [Azonexus sp.]